MRVRGYPASVPCWADVSTPDPAVSRRFYGELFGWKVVESTVEWYSGHRYVAGMIDLRRRYPVDVPPPWTVTMLVDSCAGTVHLAEKLGGRVLLAPTELGAGTYAQITDPHGAGFRVVELVPKLL